MAVQSAFTRNGKSRSVSVREESIQQLAHLDRAQAFEAELAENTKRADHEPEGAEAEAGKGA